MRALRARDVCRDVELAFGPLELEGRATLEAQLRALLSHLVGEGGKQSQGDSARMAVHWGGAGEAGEWRVAPEWESTATSSGGGGESAGGSPPAHGGMVRDAAMPLGAWYSVVEWR